MLSSTILAALYIYLLKSSKQDFIIMASAAKILRLKDTINNIQNKVLVLENNSYLNKSKINKLKRKLTKLQKTYSSIKLNKYASKNPIIPAGFTLLERFNINTTNKYYRKLHRSVNELYGKANSTVITQTILAQSIAYLIVGLCIVLSLSVIVMETLTPLKAFVITVAGIAVLFLAVYTILDDILYRVKKRKENLLYEFPQVINKLALLVNAGIEITDAWRQTAYSSYGDLYLEMQRVCRALDNGITLKHAYKDFIDRCNVKEISKLGVAIEQAHIKGNSEIAQALLDIAVLVWEERKHKAKRAGELANSKLLLPIIMVFCAIMMMVIVPIISNLGI